MTIVVIYLGIGFWLACLLISAMLRPPRLQFSRMARNFVIYVLLWPWVLCHMAHLAWIDYRETRS